jgi:hypothetical protein
MARFGRLAFALIVSGCAAGACVQSAGAAVVDYTSSAAFTAATAGIALTVEQYATGTNGQTIANGGSFDGLTYTFTSGPVGTVTGGIITDMFDSFSGLSLGGTQISGQQFFFGGDSVTVTFPEPVTAVGVFFNVNPNSGNYDLRTPVGNVSTGSSTYDTSTFVFDGITSTTAFTTITFLSENASVGSYNIPEIEYAATPLPAALPLFAAGLGAMGLVGRRRSRKNAAPVA